MNEQRGAGWIIFILALLGLLWLMKNGNALLHGEIVSATIGGQPTGPATITSDCGGC